MRNKLSAKSLLVVAAVVMSASVLFAQSAPTRIGGRPGGTNIKVVRVDLPCSVQATKIGTSNKYNVKLVATNNSGSWLQEGKKVNFTWGSSKGMAVLDIMVPDAAQFTVKKFEYTADPLLPTSFPCSAYFMKTIQ